MVRRCRCCGRPEWKTLRILMMVSRNVCAWTPKVVSRGVDEGTQCAETDPVGWVAQRGGQLGQLRPQIVPFQWHGGARCGITAPLRITGPRCRPGVKWMPARVTNGGTKCGTRLRGHLTV